MNDWTTRTRAVIAERSGGVCERCGMARATHIHHRLLRRYRDHSIANGLHVCSTCHDGIHARPKDSETAGWLVTYRPHCGPADHPVLYRGENVRLSPDGTILILTGAPEQAGGPPHRVDAGGRWGSRSEGETTA